MKFSHRYSINLGGAASGLKEKLSKLLGMEAIKTNLSIDGEMSCDVSIEEIKELLNSEDMRLSKIRNYIADGRFKNDLASVVDAFGNALCEAEKLQRAYDIETNKTRLESERLDDMFEDARAEDAQKRAAKKAAKSEE